MRVDRLWQNARLATMVPGRDVIEDGIVAAIGERIAYAGSARDAPRFDAVAHTDCEGRWITPGLIDCHTHLVHAGNRANEFEQRMIGASYEDIARAGGGILSTVRATRAASEEELTAGALPRLDALIAGGVTTVEIKSGYGLSLEDETKQLRAARALQNRRDISIATTFLGAHALPPEAGGDKDGYIESVCRDMIPAVARGKLAVAVDAFCETVGFSADQVSRVFVAAQMHGMRVKLHADQLSNSHGAALAARFHALSADHLEYSDEGGIAAMAKADVAAVLLPGAFYCLRETTPPPVASLRRHNVPIAIATDCNPGTSPLTSILSVMNMAAILFGLTVEECIAGTTRAAARALGKLHEIGTLETGKYCDLAIWNIERPAELVYRIGFNSLYTRVWRGKC